MRLRATRLRQIRLGRTQPHTLAGAYAMHALGSADTRRFERHLTRCDECATEVAEFGEVAARLAAAAAARPPAALKARAMAAVARARQLPPVLAAPGARPGRHRSGWRRTGWQRLRSRATWVAPTAAGVFLALGTVFAVTARTEQHELGRELASSRLVAAVLTAPDAVVLDVKVRSGGTAAVVMSRRERALVFAADDLRVLPPSKRYELWLISPDGDRPAGMLPDPRQGQTGPVIAAGLASGDRLGLTVEPAVGSKRPTTPMIMELTL